LEVEVVRDVVGFAGGVGEFDPKLEFAPAVFCDTKGRLFEFCRRDESVDGLAVEGVCGSSRGMASRGEMPLQNRIDLIVA
jgi:hypothetical protein